MSGETPLSTTRSVCPECLRTISAARVQRGDDVVLVKQCPEHGEFRAVIWRGSPSLDSWRRPKTPSHPLVPYRGGEKGCPGDCGLCAGHRQHTCTALIEVTRRCDLSCAYCFADGGSGAANDPGMDAVRRAYERLMLAGGPCNVQLSGGEPTLREDLPEIAALGRSMGFGFIQVNTNGLRLAREPDYAGRLKEAGVASVFLQFDGLEDSVHERLRGRALLKDKLEAVEHCRSQGLGVVLVPTLVPGVNDHQIGEIIRFGVRRIPTVRGVHFQPVSYFGRFPAPPRDAGRITIPEVLREIQDQTLGAVRVESFKPPGCENAYCSFHGNFVLMENGELRPLTRHAPGKLCCDPESAEEGAAKARRFVSRFWRAPAPSADTPRARAAQASPSLGGWDAFIERARAHSFCISGMAFQDAWNLDLERLQECCIHVVHPDGRLIPFCAYNLTDSRGRSIHRPRS